MAFIYTPTIPQPGDIPAQSQGLILGNFQYLCGNSSTGLQRDHNMTLNSTNAGDGTHKQVTFTSALGAAPSLTGGVSACYVKNVSGVNELFYNNGTDYQITYQTNPPATSVSGSANITSHTTYTIPNVPSNIAGTAYYLRAGDSKPSIAIFIFVQGFPTQVYTVGSQGQGSNFVAVSDGGGGWKIGIQNNDSTQVYHYVVIYQTTT